MAKNNKYQDWPKTDLLKEIKRLNKRKKYGLVWEDKPEDVVEQCKKKLPVLEEDSSRAIETSKDDPVNLLIEGDNYHALSVLNYTHKKKIDVIYIDPPYNRGDKDFRFNDHYVDKEDAYKHSKWLSLINRRLELARKLLKPDGVIFISIGRDEFSQLKLLCDNVFGENNFITNFIWEKTQHFGRQKINFYQNADYILAYGKKLNKNRLKEILVEKIKTDLEDAPLYNASNPEKKLVFPAKKVKFNIPDGIYSSTTNDKYKLLTPVVVKQGFNKNEFQLSFRSRWSQNRIDKEIKKGGIYWVKSNGFAIRVIYSDSKKSKAAPKQIIFTNKNNELCAYNRFGAKVGVNEEGSKELAQVVGKQNIFQYPKPSSLIEYLISLIFDYEANEYKKNLTILDFFAGSGTTGHAVLKLNEEDGGTRQFILCTNNENKIAEEVCYPRVKKVIKGYQYKGKQKKGLGGNLKYFKTAFVDANQTDKNIHQLTQKSTDMLCIKEGTYELVKSTKSFKIFTNGKKLKYTGIVYDQLAIQEFKDEISKIEGPFSVYIFSLADDTFEEEFADISNKVTLSPIPESILRVYRRIFK